MRNIRIGEGVIIIAILLFTLVYSVSAQITREYSLKLIDVSEPNCPIEISGGLFSLKEMVYADRVDSEWSMHPAIFTNISPKVIIAFEIAMDIIPEYGGKMHYVYREDGFFNEDLTFVPGSHISYEIDPSKGSITGNTINHEKVPKAEIKITFVNFDDGTCYGMSDWGGSLSKGREITIQQINELLRSFQRDGESGIRVALVNLLGRHGIPPSAQDKLQVLDQMMIGEGPQGVVTMLNKMANAAQRHARMRKVTF